MEVTALSCGLFTVDSVMIIFYFKTFSSIIKYYTKDYHLNMYVIWFFIILVAITQVIQNLWSDLFMWGSYFNQLNIKVYLYQS